ncbi:MAG: hypothetical protein JXM70_23450, partial [Pirellulales bacterium]|nr:hypothetical protein [Pirellulales bacterium]
VDGQMSLLEGDRSSSVLEMGYHFELSITDDGKTSKVIIPFDPGPFNWEDYIRLSRFPWSLVGRDRGVIYDKDGVTLETLDYYSDSRRISVPEVKLRVAHGPAPDKRNIESWEPVTLAVRSFGGHGMSPHGTGSVGAWRELAQGEIVMFGMATSKAETDAFLDSRPEGPLEFNGQIVLHAGGKKFHFSVDDLEGKPPRPLGDSGMAIELKDFDRQSLRVVLATHRVEKRIDKKENSEVDRTKPVGTLVLHGFQTNLDQQDREGGVYGSFWFDPYASEDKSDDTAKKKIVPETSRAMRMAASRPRLDIIQGHDQKLYYRTWRAPRVGTIAQLPSDGSETMVFSPSAFKTADDKTDKKSKVAATEDNLIPATVYVEKFMPSEKPEIQIRMVPFKKDGHKTPRVKVRLSIDENRQEFWLAPVATAESAAERQGVVKADEDDGRSVSLQLLNDTIELGFGVVLDNFERRLDPGTSRPAGYSSQIDFVQKPDSSGMDSAVYEEDVIVTLNQPVSFTDPTDGRTYRFFQSSFAGPYRPGDPQFDQIVGGNRKSDELYQSTFSVSSDPGRQLKYAGCLMIVAGIVVMYYMKAYFFRRKKTAKTK